MNLMKNLLQKEDLSPFFDYPTEGDMVKGKIISQERLALFVDLSPFGTGIVYGKEYFKAKKLTEIKKGLTVKAKVLDPDGEGGFIELSITKAHEEKAWKKLKKLKEEGKSLEVQISKANRGGLIAYVSGIPGFLPVSQLRPENYPKVEGGDPEKILDELKNFVGEKMEVTVLTLDPTENNLILSEKEVGSEKIAEVLEKYEEGDVVKGEITGVVDFGAFIKFPYSEGGEKSTMEGLIHISELAWQLIEDPQDVVEPGEVVEAKIIDISQGKVSLSLKSLKEDPWEEIGKEFKKGDTVEGTVTKLNPFGAFVKINEKIQGLIHISEFGTEKKMKEELDVGEKYEFKISLLDPEEHRMILKFA